MLIAVVNNSTLVSNADCQTMCEAIQIQLDLHFCPAWGLTKGTIRFYADSKAVPGYAWLISLIDDDTSVPGALGYHEMNADRVVGYIMCKPILDNGGTVMVFDSNNASQYTISGTLSHETLECIGDKFASGFTAGAPFSQGNLVAQEVCDPVESDNYGILVNGVQVAVSNFIFPSWLNSQAIAPTNMPFDYLKKLTGPFQMDSGGYVIVASLSNEGQVTARPIFGEKMPKWRRDMKLHELSRASRRTK